MTVISQEGPDAGVPWHYGDPMREQRLLEQGVGAIDLSHRGVITITGPDRLTWLHSLTTQFFEGLQPHSGVSALLLSPQGHIEHALYGVDDGDTFWCHTEPGAAAAAVKFLDRMRFMLRVEVADRTDEFAIVWRPGRPREGAACWLVPGSTHWAGMNFLCQPVNWMLFWETNGPEPGPITRCGSPPGCPGSASIPTSGASPTSLGCSVWPSTWTRAVIAARRRWAESTTSADRRAGWYCCIWTAPWRPCRPQAPHCNWARSR